MAFWMKKEVSKSHNYKQWYIIKNLLWFEDDFDSFFFKLFCVKMKNTTRTRINRKPIFSVDPGVPPIFFCSRPLELIFINHHLTKLLIEAAIADWKKVVKQGFFFFMMSFFLIAVQTRENSLGYKMLDCYSCWQT